MYTKKFFILIFFLSLPFSLSAGVIIPEKEGKMFQKNIATIVSLGRILRTGNDSVLMEKIFRKRAVLLEDSMRLYETLELRTRKPTLDVSSRYKLTLQKYKLSCEIAALRMVIESVTKKYISEDAIIRMIPIFPGSLRDDGVWGDPEKEFVGSYTGSQRGLTGYGIYESPLVRVLEKKNISAEVFNSIEKTDMFPGDRLSYVLDSLSLGSHVILWGDWCTTDIDEDGIVDKVDNYILRSLSISGKNSCDRPSDQRVISWVTPEGKNISALSGEHAFLLLGYIGSREKPSHIIVWDTDTGKHIYRTSEWMRKWSLMDYRTIIVSQKDIGGI